MSSTTIDLVPILALSTDKKMELVQTILDSIPPEEIPSDLTDEEKAELERRVDAFRADPSRGVPWEQVKAASLARARK